MASEEEGRTNGAGRGGKERGGRGRGRGYFAPFPASASSPMGRERERGGKQMKCDRLRREWGEDQSGPREGIPPLFLGGGSIFGASVERKRV